MTLTLGRPDSYRAFLEAQASRGGFGDVNAYLVNLLEDERKRWEDEAVVPLLSEALEGPPATPMTAEDWDWVRKEGREQLAKREQ